MSRKWKNWCQNEVDKETKGVDSRDKVKHNERREDDEGGRTRVTMDEERVLRGR